MLLYFVDDYIIADRNSVIPQSNLPILNYLPNKATSTTYTQSPPVNRAQQHRIQSNRPHLTSASTANPSRTQHSIQQPAQLSSRHRQWLTTPTRMPTQPRPPIYYSSQLLRPTTPPSSTGIRAAATALRYRLPQAIEPKPHIPLPLPSPRYTALHCNHHARNTLAPLRSAPLCLLSSFRRSFGYSSTLAACGVKCF